MRSEGGGRARAEDRPSAPAGATAPAMYASVVAASGRELGRAHQRHRAAVPVTRRPKLLREGLFARPGSIPPRWRSSRRTAPVRGSATRSRRSTPSGRGSGQAAGTTRAADRLDQVEYRPHSSRSSGLAGMLKAMLALEHDIAPAFGELRPCPIPEIPFDDLQPPRWCRTHCRPPCPATARSGTRASTRSGSAAPTLTWCIADPADRLHLARRSAYTSTSRSCFAITGAEPRRGATNWRATTPSPPRLLDIGARSQDDRRRRSVHQRELHGRAPRGGYGARRARLDVAGYVAHRRQVKSEDTQDAALGHRRDGNRRRRWRLRVSPAMAANGPAWAAPPTRRTARFPRGPSTSVDALFRTSTFGWSVTEALFAERPRTSSSAVHAAWRSR